MAEFRNIHTRIWTDAWFCELEPDEKLLFIYLFSNPNASVCGMYEMPKRNISTDTGIALDRVSGILDTLSSSGKVFYENGVVWVVNLKKYNDSGNSLKIAERARKDIQAISDCKLKEMYCKHENIPYLKSQIPYPEKNSETETKRDGNETDIETETDTESPPLKNNYLLYTQEVGILTPSIGDFIDLYEKEMSEKDVHDAILETSAHGAKTWSYTKTILDTWKIKGRNVKPTHNGKKSNIENNIDVVNEFLGG